VIELNSEKVKENILKSAFELFVDQTYSKVTVEAIAKKAGMSKGGLF